MGTKEDWSFAQALVASRPDDYVLTEPTIGSVPSGARRRERRERQSVVEPQPLSRFPQQAMACLVALIYVSGFVQALVRR